MRYVTVWASKFVAGWDGSADPTEWHPSISLTDALTSQYSTDAHLVPYWLENLSEDGEWLRLEDCPRLNKKSLAVLAKYGVRLRYGYALADIDCAEAHASHQPASPEWHSAMITLAEAVVPGCAWYATLGGLRIIWKTPRVFDQAEYLSHLDAARTYLQNMGLPMDSLRDFNRCYRAPFVVRNGVAQNMRHELHDPAVWEAPASTSVSGEKSGLFKGIASVTPRFDLPPLVSAGERHTVLVQAAASLRARSVPMEVLEAELRATDYATCKPPLQETPEGEAELVSILNWVANLAPGPTPRSAGGSTQPPAVIKPPAGADEPQIGMMERGDSVEIAQVLLEWVERGHEPTVHDLGELWAYQDSVGRWVTVSKELLRQTTAKLAGTPVFQRFTKEGVTTVPLKVGSKLVADVGEMLSIVRGRSGFFENARGGMALKDGFVTVDAKVGLVFRQHSANNKCRYGYDFEWTDSAPTQWLRFLDDVWSSEDVATRGALVQAAGEWIGATLLGIITRFEKGMLLYGDGANGKSTFCFIVQGLFDSSQVCSIKPQDAGKEYYRAMLAHCLLNVVAEVPATEIDATAAAALKALLSGDRLTARPIFGAPFQFTPKLGVLLALNGLPSVKDLSPGFFRKWLALPFSRTFLKHEIQRDLGKQILDNERAKIVCWALRCVVKAVASGHLTEPVQSERIIREWRDGLDEVEMWLQERTLPAATGGISPTKAYQDFRVWCEQSGLKPTSQQTFGTRIKKKVQSTVVGPEKLRERRYCITLTKPLH